MHGTCLLLVTSSWDSTYHPPWSWSSLEVGSSVANNFLNYALTQDAL